MTQTLSYVGEALRILNKSPCKCTLTYSNDSDFSPVGITVKASLWYRTDVPRQGFQKTVYLRGTVIHFLYAAIGCFQQKGRPLCVRLAPRFDGMHVSYRQYKSGVLIRFKQIFIYSYQVMNWKNRMKSPVHSFALFSPAALTMLVLDKYISVKKR